MFEALFGFIINIFFFILKIFTTIIFTPLEFVLTHLIPGLDNIFHYAITYFYKVFEFFGFVKEVLIDYLCINRELLNVMLLFMIAVFSVSPSIKAFLLIKNLWIKFKGGGK